MQLTKLEINGFRGCYRTFDLSGDTIVTAGNGKGKTTILCALLWLLCGVDDEDKVNYNLFDNKLSADDPENPLQMSVTGYFDTITISRSAKQKWNKSGQRRGDDYVYSVNDMEVTATRFNEIIETNFMPIPLLKFALNIRRWELIDERILREQIVKLASSDSTPSDSKYAVIEWALKEAGVAGAKKHFSQRRKEYSDTAQKLVLEIAAAKARQPEVKDTAEMETELAIAVDEYEAAEARIHAAIPTEILAKRGDEERAIFEKRAELKQAEVEYNANVKMQIAKAKAEWEDAMLATQRNKVRRETMKSLNKQLADAETDRQRLLTELDYVRRRRFTGLCPTCGQELQGQDRTEKLEAFKKQKEADEARIIAEGRYQAEKIVSLTNRIEELKAEILAEKETDTFGLEKVYRTTEAAYVKNKFADSDKAKQMQAELAELEANRTPLPDMTESEADKVRKGELTIKIERLRSEIAVAKNNAEVAEKMQADIDRLTTQRQTALRKAGENETALQLAKEYETEWARLLQEDINSQFKKIRIRMSDVTKGGEIVDCCKVEMANVADTLNTASRVVAGIEISLAFQRRYGVSLPMIVDNAESIERERIDADGRQLILLHMAEGQELNITKYNNQ